MPAPTVPAPATAPASAGSVGGRMADDVFPDRAMALRDKIAWMVETNGWALEPVPARPELDPPIPGYSYTIGFEQRFGFPEVVLFGLTPVASRGLVGLVADLLRGGPRSPSGRCSPACTTASLAPPCCPSTWPPAPACSSRPPSWYGGLDYRVVQLAWPDRNGWLPWESGFDGRVALAQPLLGDPPD